MTTERWERVKEVFSGALEAPTTDRPAYLQQRCGSDDDLRREVESLLAAASGDDSLPGAATVSLRAAEQAVLEGALGRHYEILRLLGQGGMGAVYLARDRMLDRFVAIKVLRPELAEAAEIRERFRREARVAAQLSHPGILPLHTFGEVGGLWYFVMGYVRGTTLAERLRLEGRLRPAEAERILVQLADALDCAHRRGVIHRDIKPANVLLDAETGNAVLADFGISKIRDSADALTRSGMVVGTPHFMSPEQALGSSQVDETSDIYSLGAVAYAMLAGHEPFADTPPGELAYLRSTQDPVPLATMAPTIAPELAEVVMRALQRDRTARWQSAREFRDALTRAGSDSSWALPESLRDLPTFGPYALAWIVIWSLLATSPERSPGERALLLLIATLIPVGLIAHVWNVERHGLTFAQVLRAACWPPEWWGMWWPRALRRPNDLWTRLPRFPRGVRAAASAAMVAMPILILGRPSIAAAIGSSDPTWFFWTEAIVAAIGIGSVAIGMGWARGAGLSPRESFRVLFGATIASQAWKEPRVARLLRSPVDGVQPPEADSPADYRRAIADTVSRLRAEVRVDGQTALTAADRLLAVIEECDAESAALLNVANPGEIDRLVAQLASLDRPTGSRVAEQRELRELLSRHLELARRASARTEAIAARRSRACDLLRGIWTQVAELHSSDGSVRASRARALLQTLVTEGP